MKKNNAATVFAVTTILVVLAALIIYIIWYYSGNDSGSTTPDNPTPGSAADTDSVIATSPAVQSGVLTSALSVMGSFFPGISALSSTDTNTTTPPTQLTQDQINAANAPDLSTLGDLSAAGVNIDPATGGSIYVLAPTN